MCFRKSQCCCRWNRNLCTTNKSGSFPVPELLKFAPASFLLCVPHTAMTQSVHLYVVSHRQSAVSQTARTQSVHLYVAISCVSHKHRQLARPQDCHLKILLISVRLQSMRKALTQLKQTVVLDRESDSDCHSLCLYAQCCQWHQWQATDAFRLFYCSSRSFVKQCQEVYL